MINSRWETFLDGLVKRALFWSPLRSYVIHKYRYAFTPAQLSCLTGLVTEAVARPGDLLEVGCYRGYTTVWLNRHLDEVAPGRRYHVVDTFGGFVAEDVQYERGMRGKNTRDDRRALAKFTINSRKWVEATLRENGIDRVEVHETPVQDWAMPPDAQFCFALIDVDLYLPTKAALESIWPRMCVGGVIVVDDCAEHHVFDGSRQALQEFCRSHGTDFELVEGKLGVLRKHG